MTRWIAAAVAVALVAAGVGVYAASRPHPKPRPSPSPSVIPTESPSPGSCHLRAAPDSAGQLVLPDPVCTPGVLNPSVSQATIRSTICVRGWTATVRPPVSYTSALKVSGMRAYGFTDSISAHEEDHLVPLELGGAPSDPLNLWPEPGASFNPKDSTELRLKNDVCAGRRTLADAQQRIAWNWLTA